MAKTTDTPRTDVSASMMASDPTPSAAGRPAKRRTKPTSAGSGGAAKKPAKRVAAKSPIKKPAKKASAAVKRRPARKTFLVAASSPEGAAEEGVRVYAAVTRSPEEAMAAVRAAIGADTTVEFTGKLSGRMAKALGLTAGEVRRI